MMRQVLLLSHTETIETMILCVFRQNTVVPLSKENKAHDKDCLQNPVHMAFADRLECFYQATDNIYPLGVFVLLRLSPCDL